MAKIFKSVVKYRWLVLLFFTLVTVFFSYHLFNLQLDTNVTNLTTGSEEEAKAIEQAARDFAVSDPLQIILLGDTNNPEMLQKAANTVYQIRALPDVFQLLSPFDTTYFSAVGFLLQTFPVAPKVPETSDEVKAFKNKLAMSPNGKMMISADGDALLLEAYIQGAGGTRGNRVVAKIEELLNETWGKDNYAITGSAYLTYAAEQSIIRDIMVLFPLAAIIVLVVLYLSFRNWWCIWAPALTVFIAIVVSMGMMAWLGYPITMVSAIMPVLLVVVASADGIHIIHTYQEKLTVARGKEEAILVTMNQLAGPVIMTSLTTALGLISLRSSTVIPVKDFGTFSALGVIVALFFALFGIPALLAVLPPLYRTKARQKQVNYDNKLLVKFSRFVSRRAYLVGIISIVILLFCTYGMRNLTVESNVARYFKSGSRVTAGINLYEEKFAGSSKVLVIVDTGKSLGAVDTDFLPVLDQLEQYIRTVSLVTDTMSIASIARDFTPDGQLYPSLVRLVYRQLPQMYTRAFLSRDNQSKTAIHVNIKSARTSQLSATLNQLENGLQELAPDELSITVAGIPKIIQYHMERFSQSQIVSLFWSAVTVLCLLILFFRSFRLGLLGILPLLFTVGINFGVMGWLDIPLDAATILIGSIAIGIGIDYSIHFINRVAVEESLGWQLSEACERTIQTTGRAILINASTLICGFGILAFSVFTTVSIFGSLMAFTMATSSLAAVIVLPALLQQTGRSLRKIK